MFGRKNKSVSDIPVEAENTTGSTDTVKADTPKKTAAHSKISPIVAVLSVVLSLLVLVAVCAVIFRIASGTRVVHVPLNDYLNVVYDGYDGQGEAEAEFDEDRFLADYSDKIKLTRMAKKVIDEEVEDAYVNEVLYEDSVPAEVFPLLFEEGTLSPAEGLKNGDETVFSWNITESTKQALKDYLGCVVDAPGFVSYASGLEEVEPVDLFAGLTLRFTGGATNGKAVIDEESESEYADELEYTIEPETGLSNGDTVTVTVSVPGADLDTYLATEYGVRAKETEKTFTVEGLSNYAESYDDLTDDVIRRMDQKAMGLIEEYYDADPEAFGNSELIPVGALFLKADDPDSDAESYNGVVMLYKAAVMVTVWEDGLDFIGRADYYTCVTFRDIEVDEFGASEVDLETAELTTASFVYNIPDTYLEGEGWLSHDLRGYETFDAMLDDCDSLYGTDYEITEYLEADMTGEDLQEDTEADTEDASDAGEEEEYTEEEEGTLEEEMPEEEGTLEEETPEDEEDAQNI